MNTLVTQGRRLGLGMAGIWVAAQLIGDVHLTGPAGQQLLALFVAAGAWTGSGLLRLVGSALWRRVPVRQWYGCLPCLLGAVVLVGVFAVIILAPVVLLWLGVAACRLFGLPLTIEGHWPLVFATVMVVIVETALGIVLRCADRQGRRRGWPFVSARIAVCFGVLWLLVALFDQVMLVPGTEPWWRQLVALGLFAVLFSTVDVLHRPDTAALRPSVIPPLALYSIVANGLMLWLVSWLSGHLEITLRIEGFATYVLAALLSTALMWTANVPMLLYPLYRVHRSGWAAGDAVSWIGGLRVSRYGYRWQAKTGSDRSGAG